MDLSNDLISKFVKITNDGDKKKTKEGTVYGTAVKYDGNMYVKIDGSDLLTPIDTTADIKEGERVTIMIKDHNATVTGNVTSPSASSKDVVEITQNIAVLDELITNKATIEDLTATNAEITNLKAKDAEIENLVADKATIEDLTATNAEITNLKAKDAEIENLVADKATIEDLTATNAEITNLKAKDAEIENLVADKADITYLDANFATIDELEATHANIEVLDAEVASINTLVNGNLTSDNILSFNITSKNTTMEDAFIKDAMIDRITASKIMSGTIDTNNVTIQSTDGSMLLQGTLLQMKDDNGKVRIQIGKDTGGNFTFILYDESGTGVLIDEEGIKSSDAIADGLIVDAKVADNANISGSKLDIASVITEVNNDHSTTIKSNKIHLDEQNQSLEVAFNSLKSQVETIQDVTIDGDLSSIVEQVQSNTTKIEANKEGINTLVAENVIRTEEISDLEGELQQVNTTLSNKYASLEQNLDGFKTTVSDTYTTKTEFNNLEVGGRNLVLNSGPMTLDKWSNLNSSWSKTLVDCSVSPTGYAIRSVCNVNNGNTGGVFSSNTRDTLGLFVDGETYTVSAWIRASKACPMDFYFERMKPHSIELSTEWQHYTYTDIYDATRPNHACIFYIAGINAEPNMWFEVHSLKLEKGSKATDWAPAPEDVQANIDAVDGKFANYSTTTQMNSAINQKANEITSSVSSTYTTKTEFNNLEVGGRNYVLSSNTEKSEPGYTFVTYDISTKAQTELQGKEVTISFEAKKTSGTANVYAYLRDPSVGSIAPESDRIGDITTSYKRYSVTFTASSDLSKASQIGIHSTTVVGLCVRNVKLEKGNMPTDWTPAPEDVQSQIDTINTNLATSYATKSELTQTNNSIVAKFSESGGYNLIKNSTGYGGSSGWTVSSGYVTSHQEGPLARTGNSHFLYFVNSSLITHEIYAYSSRFPLKGGKKYTLSGWFYMNQNVSNYDIFILTSNSLDANSTSTAYTYVHHSGARNNTGWEFVSLTFTTNSDVKSGIIRIDNNGYNGNGTTTNCNVHWSSLMLNEGSVALPWSPHPSEVYDGITKIDKDGVKVTQSNYNGYTQMKADGFYVNNGSENVISITKDGSYFKGKVVITSGSTVPTSVLSGTISSSQLNSTITSDISTAKTNASTAVSTANTASTNASNAVKTANTASTNASTAVSTANTANTNASNAVKTANTASTNASTAVSTANTAKSTADTAKSTADSVKSTVDSGKTNWNNAYNRVNEWAYGAVTGSTTIDGGYIQADTITAKHMAIGDFNNYSQLVKGKSLANRYGTATWTEGTSNHSYWVTTNQYFPFTVNETLNPFKASDRVQIKFDAYTPSTRNVQVGIWFYSGTAADTNIGSNTADVSCSATWGTKTVNLTLPSGNTYVHSAKSIAILINNGTSGERIEVRNVTIRRLVAGDLIVDGAITTAKIASRTITADRIVSGAITANEIKSRTITADRIVSGAITANEIKSRTITADRIATGVITANEIAANAITAAKIAAGAITAAKIAAGAITADKLAANAITSKTITGSTITGGTINGATITSETLMKSYGGVYVGSEIWGGFKKGSNGNYSSAQTFTIRGSTALQIDGNPTRISSVTGEVKIGDASSYDNLRACCLYAQEIVYTDDIRARTTGAALLMENISMRATNAYVQFTSGLGVVRVKERNHLYLQTGGNTGGDTSAEIRCTRYTDASNYVNIRAHNVCAQNAVYAAGVNVSSDRARKRDIELYSTDALQEVCSTPVYAYHLDTDKDEELKRIGIIMQEAPLDAIDLTGKGVDLYQMVTMLWRAIQQQQEIINELKGE